MKQHRRGKKLCLGLVTGTAILFSGGIAPDQTAHAAPAAPILVTSAADAGPNTLRAALQTADLREGEDTIIIDAGLDIGLETTLLSESEIILTVADGGRATLSAVGDHWNQGSSPKPLLESQESAHISHLDLRGNGTRAMGIWAENRSHAFTLQDMTFDNFRNRAIRAARSFFFPPTGPITLDRVTVTRSGAAGLWREGAVEITQGSSVVVRDSAFINNRGYPPRFARENMPANQQILLENNSFIGGPEQEWGCVDINADVFSVEGGAFTEPAVVFRHNVVESCVSPDVGHQNRSPVHFYFGAEVARATQGDTGILVEGNTVSGSSGSHSAGFSYETFTHEPDFRNAIRFVNNTIEVNPETALPAIHLEAKHSAAIEVLHNTILGGGIAAVPAVLAQWGQEYPAPSIALVNNIIDSGADPAYALLDPVEGSDAVVSGSNNAVTTVGSDLPATIGMTLTREDMLLGASSANGNPHAPLSRLPAEGSPLIDAAVTHPHTPALDQRGQARVQGPAPDIGAVEASYTPPVVDPVEITISEDVTVREGTDTVFLVSRSGPPEVPAAITVATKDGTAVADIDYVPYRAPLSWEAGNTDPIRVAIPTLIRDGENGKRTFSVVLLDPAEGTVTGERAKTHGIITDLPKPTPLPTESSEPPATGTPEGGVPPRSDGPGGELSGTGAGGWGIGLGAALALLIGGGLLRRRFAHGDGR